MTSVSTQVDSPDQVGEARRRAAALAASIHLDEASAGRLAIVVTECANNLWKHAGGGEIVLSAPSAADPCVEMLALDQGPGMADIARCFQDGYSTAGSSGTGLGAVARLSDSHEVHSLPGKGTALLARVRGAAFRPPPKPALEIGGLSIPMHGETSCGDDFAVTAGPRSSTIMVVDGLGHGPVAADCAAAAVSAFRECNGAGPSDALREIHGGLRGSRGAAVAVAQIDLDRRELRFAGIGNIAGFIWHDRRARHLVSFPGIVGNEMRTVRDLTYELGPDVLLLLYSDGISTHWSLESYGEVLLSRDPALIAGAVYRDHRRRRDDATVVVARESAT